MNFVLSMSSALFNGILDKMVVDLNVSLSKVGYLTSFYAFGAGIGVPIFLII
ncbi:MAG: MFS transporter, partial [Erysipelatoclostridium sp.]|nr:MFS transporter [Thomasclavelia sp.]